MAGLNIHLAIGKRYFEKTNIIKDEQAFYKGVIAPDLALNKKLSHHSNIFDTKDLISFLAGKVQLYNFLKQEYIDSDFKNGVFLHLITDYIFYTEFFDKEYLNNVDYKTFNNNLYYSYDLTDKYLENKYNLDFKYLLDLINNTKKRASKEKNTTYDNSIDVLPIDKLDLFIEELASINLDKYRKKILINKKNILP